MDRDDLLYAAREVAEDYQAQGYSLTLRQLYYQLVAKGLVPNSQKSYNRLGSTLSTARLKGTFDMDLIVDRGRSAGASKQHEAKVDVEVALDEASSYIASIPRWTVSIDRWFGQPYYVSVWVEKDALSGVFEKPCKDLGVGFFACKGYPSHSALWEWLKGLEAAYAESGVLLEDDDGWEEEVPHIEEAVVLYFGDHDPDGWQIPRSAEEAINTFIEVQGLDVPPVRFERVALNMDQIRRYNPPPFAAKMSSSRFASYYKEHRTQKAWELDALSPAVLDRLIRDEVGNLFDPAIWAKWKTFRDANRSRLKHRMSEGDWLQEALDG